MSAVIDNSVFLGWCVPAEQNASMLEFLRSVKNARLHVPSIWPVEFSNAMGRNLLSGRILEADVRRALELVTLLNIDIAPGWNQFNLGEAIGLMKQYALTAYDASYLALALRRSLPLATLDKDLRKAALSAGVPLVL